MTGTPSIGWTTLTVDCADAELLGTFYSRLFGWEITARDGAGWLQLRNPHGGIGLKTRLRIMLDPAGHPFCLFVDGE